MMGRRTVLLDVCTKSGAEDWLVGCSDVEKDDGDVCRSRGCYPHRRKHCIAPTLQMAVMPRPSAGTHNPEEGDIP
jgi:hypothetical protein